MSLWWIINGVFWCLEYFQAERSLSQSAAGKLTWLKIAGLGPGLGEADWMASDWSELGPLWPLIGGNWPASARRVTSTTKCHETWKLCGQLYKKYFEKCSCQKTFCQYHFIHTLVGKRYMFNHSSVQDLLREFSRPTISGFYSDASYSLVEW